ncbi:acyltransferase [Thermaerobacillus caldiproteolyticus]|uniref:Surface polysaccharide O-acyltransferase-like enzyme n=1 Tax=Thermaerobacillus caldiproteolyticus TaxID=247480 RepID=A0A7W0BYC1_9BACL|nr:acyltransferase [Anoxybacillus caldiproteolyticus]MBA2875541.1 surface polysaccharide O-acyltransferase-like enzyme [Anoxybacillus caldiproteolyticus]
MERNYSIDFIKFFAIFAVVSIHTAPFLHYKNEFIEGENIGFIINVFARFGVPYFFAASGYLLGKKIKITKNKNSFSYIKHYLLKIVKLLISWTIIYFLYDLLILVITSYLNGLHIKSEVIHYLNSAFTLRRLYYGMTYGTSFHLWFLMALMWCIVILYFFIKINKIHLLLVFSVILNFIGLFGQSYSSIFNVPLQTRDALFFGLFYVTLGYYLSKKYEAQTLRVSPTLLFILFILFTLFQLVEAYVLVKRFGGPWGNYYIFTIPSTICLILMVINYQSLGKGTFISKVGQSSFGIYVIHPLIISLTYHALIFLEIEYITRTLIWNLLYSPILFVLSYFLYHLLQYLKAIIYNKTQQKLANIRTST